MIEEYCVNPNDRLILMRVACKCSQRQFSKVLGITRSKYNRIEKSGNNIKISYLSGLRKFNLNPEFILGNSEMVIGKSTIDSIRNKISSHIKNLENS